MIEPYKRVYPWLTVGKLKEAIEDLPADSFVYLQEIPTANIDNIGRVLKPDLFNYEFNIRHNKRPMVIKYYYASDTIKYTGDDNLYIVSGLLKG